MRLCVLEDERIQTKNPFQMLSKITFLQLYSVTLIINYFLYYNTRGSVSHLGIPLICFCPSRVIQFSDQRCNKFLSSAFENAVL